jgi:hypothetical protein
VTSGSHRRGEAVAAAAQGSGYRISAPEAAQRHQGHQEHPEVRAALPHDQLKLTVNADSALARSPKGP